MLVPVGDQAPRRGFPFVTHLIILANVGIYFYLVLSLGGEGYARVVGAHGLTPARWQLLQFLTSMFLHAGLVHLIGNILFLKIAGDNVEGRLGHVGFVFFYVACGVVGGMVHMVSAPGSTIPCIGASGAISGVLGAFVVFFPTSPVRLALIIWPIKLPSWLAIGGWLTLQVMMARQQMQGEPTQVAVWAHIGGFAAGFLVALWVRLRSR